MKEILRALSRPPEHLRSYVPIHHPVEASSNSNGARFGLLPEPQAAATYREEMERETASNLRRPDREADIQSAGPDLLDLAPIAASRSFACIWRSPGLSFKSCRARDVG